MMKHYYSHYLPPKYYTDLHDIHAAQTPQWSTISLTPAQLGLYYRIMVFIPANIYPCITLGDFPERFVKVPPSHSQVPAEIVYRWAREQGGESMKKMFGVLEGLMFRSDSSGAGEGEMPYAVGRCRMRWGVLVLLWQTCISRWLLIMRLGLGPSLHSPVLPCDLMQFNRPMWLREHCPRVYACARETLKHPVLRKVFLEQEFECHLAE
jgi:hypothetical protein